MDADQARQRLAAHRHGVLATMHAVRGPDPQPVVYAVAGGVLGVPVDAVKPKSTTRLAREANLAADPRAALLVEHWDPDDWSRLWWVRAHLVHVLKPTTGAVEELADRLAHTFPQYADRPFHRIIVLRVTDVTGWAATDSVYE
ncbi:PPOX class probable F420-dependent enzyme [Branchiibius hedensis]|uniref:PPOX class probable F420-dependent enzyme, Rv0121 family n=1 Tax=Branchiibius hedensis TaxID=672460 RepID=A0A2Y8ZPG6_9MICO|nr:pyridoxamine 5'-phosphate oxidase family protein [Branchiibius hedensis]PWJ25010.1 PPOX class probable F420-dependent enzyme [Branchiibius hedensis]SSA33825.1 PPOX class probable F420-dependent enzyme, Rv0121 family [Branchiibius hedensis]